jgi:integrase
MPKITKRVVDQLKAEPNRDQFVWDSELRGFGIRVKRTGASSYLVNYRTPEGRQRRLAFAKVGVLTPDEARKKAQSYLAAIANGADPSGERHRARATMTVGDLCNAYMKAAEAGLVIVKRFGRPKSPSTISIDKGRVARHIKPCIGHIPVTKLMRADVQKMVDQITQGKTNGAFKTKPRGKAVVKGGAGTAARVVEFFGGIWTWAEGQGLVSGVSPVRGVQRAAPGTSDRVLSFAELAALGRVLDEKQIVQRDATAAVRLIALTGMRREEACRLRWREIDWTSRCFRLEKTKTGRSMRPMGSGAAKVLQSLIGRNGTEWMFPNIDGSGPADLKGRIAGLFDAAGLKDARSQVLRRTFATVAALHGYSESTIDDMIGHARRSVTARYYVRVPDEVLLGAAGRVSERIAAALRGELKGAEVLHFRDFEHQVLAPTPMVGHALA